MQTTYSYNEEVENYWKLLKNASSEVKLRLIALLSQSLMEKEHGDAKAIPASSTEKFINRFSGAWHGKDTAREIIDIIHEGRSCRKPISFD
ncbi:hypothetical protein [uncultured Duncaniella sp.]|uniref:hypothetical protein n=1 Tax=uncultured Duncaniella sp. TaxID=2768039 RepID=UPI0025B5FED7|nr:hypothetical protein [uncultured Duncaniella sp.]